MHACSTDKCSAEGTACCFQQLFLAAIIIVGFKVGFRAVSSSLQVDRTFV